jgi:hypothetical protein
MLLQACGMSHTVCATDVTLIDKLIDVLHWYVAVFRATVDGIPALAVA